MTTKKRDLRLDILKGIGCALMVVAHSKLKMYDYERYIFWGNLAPALFFSVSGVTAGFQAGKPPRQMLFLYGFIFLLGFSYNGFLEPNFLDSFYLEIIQTIALGVLVVYLIERYLHPPVWVYLLLGLIAFGLDKLIYPLGIEGLEGILIAPGLFPLLPWLSMFFFGIPAYRMRNLYNLALFLVLFTVYIILYGFTIPDVNGGKWQFLPAFFIASSAFLFLMFFLVCSIPALSHPKLNILTIFWGTYSLLFLYLHYAFIKLFRLFELQRNTELVWNHPWLFWVLVLAATTITMLPLTFMARRIEFPFQHLVTWAVLLCLIFSAPFVISKPSHVSYFELLPGIAFASFYPKLGNLLMQERS